MKLREYQKTALEHIKSSLEKGYKAPLLVLPTGAGKTVIFSELAKEFVNSGKKVLILVHRRELLQQACNKLNLINVKYGIISAGFKRARLKDNHKLQVASVYTLYRNLHNELFEPDVIIFDEAHHVAAGTWVKIVKRYNQSLKIGVTATPIRLDNKPLGKYFDNLIQGVQVQELVNKNFLCNHKVFAGNVKPNLSKLKFKRGDYKKKDLKEVMDQPFITGDAVEQYKKHLLGKPAIAFCVDIDHAKKVNAQFVSEGVKSEVLTGEMSISERDVVLNKLRNHDIDVIVSIDIISEGTDLPCVTGAILLRPTNSEALYMQQVGRILRPEKNKTAIVLDHVGNTYRHDFIDIEKNWVLKEEEEKLRPKGKPIFITCKKCNFIFKPQKSCPNCGFEIPKKDLISLEGQLTELKKEKENSPSTIYAKYNLSIYAQKKYHKQNIFKFNEIRKKNKILINNMHLGSNIVYYEGMNKQRFGIVIGYIDNGYIDDYDSYLYIPAISDIDKNEGYRFCFDDIIKENLKEEDIPHINVKQFINLKKRKNNSYGATLDALTKYKDDTWIVFQEHGTKWWFELSRLPVIFDGRQNRYVYLKKRDNKGCLLSKRQYLDSKRIYIGKRKLDYSKILLTEDGLKIVNSNNYKHGEKITKQINKIKYNKNTLYEFINIAKQANFKIGYNTDWIYRNFYARKFIHQIKKIIK